MFDKIKNLFKGKVEDIDEFSLFMLQVRQEADAKIESVYPEVCPHASCVFGANAITSKGSYKAECLFTKQCNAENNYIKFVDLTKITNMWEKDKK